MVVAAVHYREFERYAHEAVGRTVGLIEPELTALREGREAGVAVAEGGDRSWRRPSGRQRWRRRRRTLQERSGRTGPRHVPRDPHPRRLLPDACPAPARVAQHPPCLTDRTCSAGHLVLHAVGDLRLRRGRTVVEPLGDHMMQGSWPAARLSRWLVSNGPHEGGFDRRRRWSRIRRVLRVDRFRLVGMGSRPGMVVEAVVQWLRPGCRARTPLRGLKRWLRPSFRGRLR